MAQGRSQLEPDERLLPISKMRADEQLRVIRAACSSTASFVNATRIAEATGLDAKKCGLVPAFLLETGLLKKAGGHFSRYRPTATGAQIAAAWQEGDESGLRALRSAWSDQWFALTLRDRLQHGPVPRDGLVARLLKTARAETRRMRQAEVLLDLLVAVRMVAPDSDGFMIWRDSPVHGTPHAHDRTDDTATPSPPGDAHDDGTPDEGARSDSSSRAQPESETHHSESDTSTQGADIPPPRQESVGPSAAPSSDVNADLDLLALLCPPILLADLIRLSPEEVMQLHGHLRGLATLTAKLRGQAAL
ncbi:hypothetical protein [Streptomyces sp. NPDC047108]|uniref:hypothetical protein n=1 Tax=Streptomyces sp. NPDC047108 TaxID=3155025 RepID=UPI0034059EF1